jgi:predicted transposase/invertase (TIGR01784 family)
MPQVSYLSTSRPPNHRLPKPREDCVAKRILRVSEPVLVDFINSTVELSRPICRATVLNPEITKDEVADYTVVLDVLAMSETGDLFIIEMQQRRHRWLRRRMSKYCSRVFGKQFGNPYDDKRTVTCIAMVCFDETGVDRIHSVVNYRITGSEEIFDDSIGLHLLEVGKAKRCVDDPYAATPGGSYARFFGADNDADLLSAARERPMIMEAYKMLHNARRTGQTRENPRNHSHPTHNKLNKCRPKNT